MRHGGGGGDGVCLRMCWLGWHGRDWRTELNREKEEGKKCENELFQNPEKHNSGLSKVMYSSEL